MKLHPILHKTKGFLRRACDVVPPTWRGAILALASGLSLYFYGFGNLDLVLYVTGVSGLVMLLLSSLTIGGAALWMRHRIATERTAGEAGGRRVEAGSPIKTGFTLPGLNWLPLVKVRWEWVHPGEVEVRLRGEGRRLREEVFARRRGLTGAIHRRILVEDAFGLSRVAWDDIDPAPVTILPHRGELRHMPVVQSMTSHEGMPHPSGAPEGDRMDIRRYAPGDSVRNILWKTYARTRTLNVRIPELSIERAKKTIAYLLTGPDDEAAAAAARVALEAGSLGEEWVFGADGTSGATENLEGALQAIARSGSFREVGGAENGNGKNGSGDGTKNPHSGLGDFLRQVGNQGEVHCIIFASSRPGEWTEDALEAASAYPGAMSFVLGTDGVRRPRPRSWWQQLLFAEEPPAATSLDELSALLRQLGSAGCPSLVIDRESGRSFNQAQQQALSTSGASG